VAKVDYFRQGNTFYNADGPCEEGECDAKCRFPNCTPVAAEYDTTKEADRAEQQFKLLNKRTETL